MVNERKRKQASAAGKASGEKRSRETRNRNRNIAIAYVFLKGGRQSDSWNKKARDFLRDNGAVLDDESVKPTEILANCTGLSVRRIEQVLKDFNEYINNCFGVSKEELSVIDIVSERLGKARELNGYTLKEAAEKMGISPAKLKNYESGKSNHIPLSVIKKASEIYFMPTDYFFGVLSEEDYGDIDEKKIRETSYLNKFIERRHHESMDTLIISYSKLAVIAYEVQALVKAVIKIKKAALRVVELNPGADINLKGGGNVSNSIGEAVAIAHGSAVKLVRAKLLPHDSLKEFK
ncbi:MAG: helix-turn-helix domain-containing protein [Methylobacter sp.]